jgi:hypothetical protein
MTDRPAGPRVAGTGEVPRPEVRGPGSGVQGARIAETVTRGLARGVEAAVDALPAGATHIPRLRLRLPAGAGEDEIAQALQRALTATERERRP